MLEHPDSPRALSQNLAHAVGIEPHDDAQQNHLRLVSRQAQQMGQRSVKSESRLEAPIALRRVAFEQLGGHRIGAPAASAPAGIDDASPADRERPTEEPVPISLEPAQARGDLEPDVRRDVLSPAPGNRDPQIAKEARMDVPPDSSHGPLLAQASGGQDAAEGGFGQIAHVVPHTHIGAWDIERESSDPQSLHQPWAISTSLGSSPAPNARYSTPSGPASTSRIVSLSIRIASHWPSSTISSSTLILAEPLVTT